MKTYSRSSQWLRLILGLFLIGYALNKFFHFFPTSYGQMPETTKNFLDATLIFLPYLYIFEIILGVFLLLNKWSAFIYIVLFPLTVSFLIFTLMNKDFSDMLPALIVAYLNVILLYNERDKYKHLFT